MANCPDFPAWVKLNKVSLDISEIQCTCFVWPVPKTNMLAGFIKFAGIYRPGSSGTDDALFINWRINEFCNLEFPAPIRALVVDFCELNYEWCDDLDVQPESLRRSQLPIRVVVRPESFETFRGILGDRELRTDLQKPFEEIKKILQRKV